jgi:hypothetical protein
LQPYRFDVTLLFVNNARRRNQMAKTLTIGEMLEAARDSMMSDADYWVETFERLGTLLARRLADHLNLATTEADLDLAMVAAPFYAHFEGQKCPEPIERFDEGEPLTTFAAHERMIKGLMERTN